MELVDILVLGTSAERRAGSNPAEGTFEIFKVKKNSCLIYSFEVKSYFIKKSGSRVCPSLLGEWTELLSPY